jgi:O-methyltransferase
MSASVPSDPSAAQLYLDLMKRALTDSIFLDDPLAHYALQRTKPETLWLKRQVLHGLSVLLRRYQMRIVESVGIADPTERAVARQSGADWPVRAHTMIGMKRLDNLQHCVESVIRNGVPGDLIETGVWRGGACIFMRAVLKAYGDPGRKIWVADSFAGLPPPNPEKYRADAGDTLHTYSNLRVSQDEVQENFRRYGLLDERVGFLKGWFKDTLPTAPISQLAVIRLDGDMYESTIQALEALYDKLSPGGFVIVDDYFLAPCAQAIHDFRDTRGIADRLVDIDGIGSFWQRGA